MHTMKTIIIVIVLLGLMAACAPKGAKPISPEDTPPTHYLQGMELVEDGKVDEAKKRFSRALELDPRYAPALAGKGLVIALRIDDLRGEDHKELDNDNFRDLLERAQGNANNKEEAFIVAVTGVRAETAAKGADWIHEARMWATKGRRIKGVNENGLPYYRNVEALSYFAGKACFEAGEYGQAKEMLSKVVGNDGSKWHPVANSLFARIHKIEQAMANYTLTGVSKVIAAKESVSRADVAVLLVSELDFNTVFARRLSAAMLSSSPFLPADVANHHFKAEIVNLLSWNVRGLEPMYDERSRAELFYPARPVKRKEMALVLEDILIMVTADQSLANRYFGQDSSPYADVHPTEPYYNAVVNAVTRNLMETDMTGAFRPDEDLDGAELLLAVVRLRIALD